MKAVNQCLKNVLATDDQDTLKEYIKHMIDQNYEEIKSAIEFDDDIFRFGGDLRLTEEEEIVKQKMQELKQTFEKQSNPNKKRSSKTSEKIDDHFGEDIQQKIEQFKSSRNEQLLIFGGMFVSMIGFSIFLCKRGLFSSNENLDDGIKTMQDVTQQREKLTNLKQKLLKIEKIMAAKMKELGLEDELEKLNQEEAAANNKSKK